MVTELAIRLDSQPHQYPIRIGAGVLSELPLMLKELLPRSQKVMIITDSIVAAHLEKRVVDLLTQAGYGVSVSILLPGESHKTMETLAELYDEALQAGLKRNDVAIALGGGIIGDVTGFFAATYRRGIPFIQIPTTLLAQVDASVGGKVAINWRHLKNMIGHFYQPHGVLIDTVILKTLPHREWVCGLAEVVKYGFLEQSSPGFVPEHALLPLLQEHDFDSVKTVLSEVIARCCAIKGAVVMADPEETRGIRDLLNLGHTFAHAYETLSQGQIQHGEAVSMGMMKAFSLANKLGYVSVEQVEMVKQLMEAYQLPTAPPVCYPTEALLQTMMQDKKNQSGNTIRLILPVGSIGRVEIRDDISTETIRQIL